MDLETLAIRYETLGEDQVRGSLDRITDSTRQMTLTQMEAIKANDALAESQTAAGVAAGGHGFQIGRLRQDLGSLIGRLTGTNLAVDRVGAALGAMAIGNVAIIAALAGIAALAFGWEKLSLSLKGVTADQEKAIETIEKAQKLKDAGGVKGEADTGLLAEIAKGQQQVDALRARIDEIKKSAAAPGQAAGSGTEEITDLEAQIARLKQPLDEKLSLWQRNRADINKEQAKEEESNLEHYATQLAELVRSNIATDGERNHALQMEKNYFAAAKLLAQQGNIELAAEYQKLGDILKGAFTKSEKVPKEKFPGLADFLNTQKEEAAALKETHDLQVRLEEDSADKTEEKYKKIKALDQAYLLEVGSLYGFESKEYDAMLKEIEDHRRKHTDVIVAEARKETEQLNKAADEQSIEDEKQLNKRKQAAITLANDVARGIQQISSAAFAKGANLSSVGKAFEDAIIGTLGSVITKSGEAWLQYGIITAGLGPLLANPFTGAAASIAAGSALIALGSALGSIASGGGGGGGAGSGPVQSTLAPVSFAGTLSLGGNAAGVSGQITPLAPVNVTLIGANDPVAQRGIMELIANAQRRNF